METKIYDKNGIVIREAMPEDYGEILRLNEESVQFLSPMNLDRLRHLKNECELFWVAENQGKIQAFIIAFREGADYDSVNYQWFENHYDKFLYIDRIVVDIGARKAGLGKLIYDAIFIYAGKSAVNQITAEIDIEPANPVSLRFHERYGFHEVGRQEVAGGSKIVSLQVSEL